MGWATPYISKLLEGAPVQFRPRGNSMHPLIKSGALVTVEPLTRDPQIGDIVLCRVNGQQYLHKVTAVNGDRYQISNNRGHINGWVGRRAIYGVTSKVE
jgi:phage repressor protein C with HTH and peptisase S24 domain